MGHTMAGATAGEHVTNLVLVAAFFAVGRCAF